MASTTRQPRLRWQLAAIAAVTALAAAVLLVYLTSLPSRAPGRPAATGPYTWLDGTCTRSGR